MRGSEAACFHQHLAETHGDTAVHLALDLRAIDGAATVVRGHDSLEKAKETEKEQAEQKKAGAEPFGRLRAGLLGPVT